MYTSIKEGKHESKNEKGINKNFVDNESKILFNKSYIRHEMNRIQNKTHDMGLSIINKMSLSSCNHKIYIPKDGYSSWSHFRKSAGWPYKNFYRV